MPTRQWTQDQLIAAVATSKTYKDVARKLGMKVPLSGETGAYRTVRQWIKKLNLDTTHFDPNFHKNGPRTNKRSEMLQKLLVSDAPSYATSLLRTYMIDAGLLEEICSECGQGPFWNHKPLRLQLDHINGDRQDNRKENLRILCPNCHTQTETYAGKKKWKGARVR